MQNVYSAFLEQASPAHTLQQKNKSNVHTTNTQQICGMHVLHADVVKRANKRTSLRSIGKSIGSASILDSMLMIRNGEREGSGATERCFSVQILLCNVYTEKKKSHAYTHTHTHTHIHTHTQCDTHAHARLWTHSRHTLQLVPSSTGGGTPATSRDRMSQRGPAAAAHAQSPSPMRRRRRWKQRAWMRA